MLFLPNKLNMPNFVIKTQQHLRNDKDKKSKIDIQPRWLNKKLKITAKFKGVFVIRHNEQQS